MRVLQNLIPTEYATTAQSTTQSLSFPESTARDVMTEAAQDIAITLEFLLGTPPSSHPWISESGD